MCSRKKILADNIILLETRKGILGEMRNNKLQNCLLVLICITCITSCFSKKYDFKDYYGTWTLETANDDSVDSLLDMGLIIQLRLEEDDVFNIWYIIETERELMNSGTWKINEKNNYAEFQIPDNEYGGYINGKLVISGKKLHYITRSADWIFR